MLDKAKEGIKKANDHLAQEFSQLQLGTANPALLDGVKIENYGSMQALNTVASISTLDAQTLTISPWDKTIIHTIAKAITDAGLGLNPQTMADSVLISIPPLTEERRKEIAKIVKRL
jgi:ribosome recycling factor